MAPSSPSPPTKLLLTDSKPKSKLESVAAPPNSGSSTSGVHAAPPKKRTRDRPNLFNCHCCGRRINQDNPKDRLQTMDSIWRIVLLCRKCRNSIGSGRTCPYCFKETGDSGYTCQCSVCDRKIHEDCIRVYSNYRPWCYLGDGLEGFGVCVDCWVPDLLKNLVRVRRSEKKGGMKNKAKAEDLGEKAVTDTDEHVNLVRNSKKKRNNVVDLANGALNLVVKKDNDGNLSNAAVLATQSHQAMNSSSRNLSSNCLENLSFLDVADKRIWKGFTYERSGKRNGEGQKLEMCSSDTGNRRMKQPVDNGLINDSDGSLIGLLTYHQDQKWKKWLLSIENTAASEASHQSVEFSLHLDGTRTLTLPKSSADITEGSDDINADEIDMCKNVGRFGKQYARTRFKQKMGQVNGSNDKLEISTTVNGLCNDVDISNLGLLCYKRDKKRKIWQVKDGSSMVSEASLQTVMFNSFNLHLDDARVRDAVSSGDLCTDINRFGQVNGSIDRLEGSANSNGLRDSVNRVNPVLLTHRRDKKRKKWLLNYENSIVSEANQQKLKFILQLDDGETRKTGTELSESSININTDQSDMCTNVDGLGQKLVSFSPNGSQVRSSIEISEEGSHDAKRLSNDFSVLNIGLLPHTWDSTWKIKQSNDVSSVDSEACQQNVKFNLHHQSDLPLRVYKRTRIRQRQLFLQAGQEEEELAKK